MKAKSMALGLSAAALVLAGCGGWNQNPLADRGDGFAGGRDKPSNPIGKPPLPSDSVRVIGPDFVTFAEEEQQEIQLEGRALLEGYTVALDIENMSEFPGAVYDTTERTLIWTPPAGFVESKIAGDYSVELYLDVRVVATKPDKKTLIARKSIPLTVKRAFLAPEILRTERSEEWLREGQEALFTFYYQDRDAKDEDRRTWGQIQLQGIPGAKSLTGLLEYVRSEKVAPQQYKAIYKIALRDVELTKSIDMFSVNAVVVSRYGKSSAVRRVDMEIATSFAAPVSTWAEDLEVTAEQTLVYKFLILDPKQEAVLALESFAGLPESANLACINTARSILNCTLTWTPTQADVNTYTVQGNVKSTNSNTRDTLQWLKTLYFHVRVLPKGA